MDIRRDDALARFAAGLVARGRQSLLPQVRHRGIEVAPSDASRARLQSITPAPVLSRSTLISAGLIIGLVSISGRFLDHLLGGVFRRAAGRIVRRSRTPEARHSRHPLWRLRSGGLGQCRFAIELGIGIFVELDAGRAPGTFASLGFLILLGLRLEHECLA